MALQKQKVQLVPEKLDTSRDSKTAAIGTVIEAQNCYRNKGGAYLRRTGRTALPTMGANVWQLAQYSGSLIGLSKHTAAARMLRRYSTTANAWAVSGAGPGADTSPIYTQQRGPIVSSRRSIHSADMAARRAPGWPDVARIAGTSYAVCVFQEDITNGLTPGSSFMVIVVDLASPTAEALYRGAWVGQSASCCAVGDSVVIVYSNAAGTNTQFLIWDAARVAAGSPTAGTNFSSVAQVADPASRRTDCYSDGDYLYVAFLTTTAMTVRVVKFDVATGASIGVSSAITLDCNRGLGWLQNDTDNGIRVLVGGGTTDGVKAIVSSSTLTGGSPITLDTNAGVKSSAMNFTGYVTGDAAAGQFVVVYGVGAVDTAQPSDRLTRVASVDASAVVTAGAVWQRSVAPQSKAFRASSGEWYLAVSYMSDTQPMYGLMRLPTATTAVTPENPRDRSFTTKFNMWRANHLPNDATTAYAGGVTPLTSVAAAPTGFFMAVPRQGLSVAAAANNSTGGVLPLFPSAKMGIDIVTLRADPTTTGAPVEFADQLLVAAGQVLEFDGEQLAECGFPMYPEPIKLTVASSGSGLAAGVYQYCHVFRYIDSRGRVHRSAPSVPTSTPTITAGQKVTLSTGTASTTNQLPTCRIMGRTAYSTATYNNLTIEIYRTKANLTVFYLLAEIANDPAADTTAEFIDGTTVDVDDDVLERATLLYCSPTGVLENHAPPQFVAMCTHRGRAVGISADDGLIWVSKPLAAGLGPEFSSALTFSVDDEYGTPTAVASMDDKLIVFKAEAIYVITGDGPNNAGLGTYPPPMRLPGVGTTQARSVLSTPSGVFFHSDKGLWVLGRGLTPENAGMAVKDWLSESVGLTVIDVVPDPSRSEIRFFLSTGKAVVFNYYFNDWAVHTNQTIIAAVSAGGDIYQCPSAAAVSIDSSLYTDDAVAAYQMVVATAWIPTNGIKGFGRFWGAQPLGEYVGAHNVIVTLARNYVDTVVQTSQMWAQNPWPFDFRPGDGLQQGSAFKLTIKDGKPATGTITCVAKASMVNAETVTVSDGVNTPTVFTFYTSAAGTTTQYNRAVNISGATSAADVAAILVTAMLAAQAAGNFDVTASDSGSGVVALRADKAGSTPNVTITETVANAGFLVTGMSTGGDYISTAGFSFSAWALEFGVKANLDKLADSRRM